MQPLPAVFVRTGRSHWCHGQMAFGLRSRNEKNGGRRKWVDQYVQKKGLNSDTKQLTFKAVLTKGCHHGAGFLLGDDTSLKKQIILWHLHIACVSMLSSMCLRSMHAWCGRHPQSFAKRSIVSRFTCWDDCKRSRSEASFLGSPAEMIAQCKANEAEKTVKGLIDFAAYQTMGLVYSPTWTVDFLYNIIPGLFLI